MTEKQLPKELPRTPVNPETNDFGSWVDGRTTQRDADQSLYASALTRIAELGKESVVWQVRSEMQGREVKRLEEQEVSLRAALAKLREAMPTFTPDEARALCYLTTGICSGCVNQHKCDVGACIENMASARAKLAPLAALRVLGDA
jgi:hypothetical protein